MKKEDIDSIKAIQNSVVFVEFNSEYATVQLSDNCGVVDDNSLSKALKQHMLLKYKYLCIHCKKC